MPVMLGGGSSEKLSRCYLGDQLLVGGKCKFEFYYDFRNKTNQDFINDGWTINRQGTIVSTGVYSYKFVKKNSIDLTNAKLITIIVTTNKVDQSLRSSGAGSAGPGFEYQSNEWSWIGGGRSTLSSSWCGTLYNIIVGSTGPGGFDTRTNWSGTLLPYGYGELKTTIDLVNKSAYVTYKQNGSLITSTSYTLADSLIEYYRGGRFTDIGADTDASGAVMCDLYISVE